MSLGGFKDVEYESLEFDNESHTKSEGKLVTLELLLMNLVMRYKIGVQRMSRIPILIEIMMKEII